MTTANAKTNTLPAPVIRKAARPKPAFTALALLGVDMVSLLIAASLGAYIWQLFNPSVQPSVFYALWPILLMFPLSYTFLGLYPGVGIDPVFELRWLTYITTAVYLVVALVLFLSKDVQLASRGIYLTSWLLSLFAVPVGRAALRMACAKRDWWGVPVLIMGAGKTGSLLSQRLIRNPHLGLKPLAFVDDDASKHSLSPSGVPVVGTLADAPAIARQHKVRHALIAMPGVKPAHLTTLLRQYASVFPHLIIVPDMFGMASLGVTAKDFAGVVGLHARQNLLLRRNRFLKRSLDILLLLPAIFVALPLILLACLWIITVSPGSPFYRQEREGFGGRTIKVWKLRTMHKNSDALLERHLAENPEAKAEWQQHFKLKEDPRIIRGGSVLRKTSIDELPQLINVIFGEMSFVGPRPFPYYHLEGFGQNFRDLRIEAQPGITGLWQVSGRSDGDLGFQEEMDSYYILNWSIWLDIYILARTPWAVLFGKGAY